jgi:L-lactate dehydrogenase complex protein LldG
MISKARENIFKKIRQALVNTTPVPFIKSEGQNSLVQPADNELEIIFAEQFTALQGKFSFSINHKELCEQLVQLVTQKKYTKIYCEEPIIVALLNKNGFVFTPYKDLPTCEIAITTCESLVARTGSMVLSSAMPQGRTGSVYTPVHICLANTQQLVYDVKEALQLLKDKYGEQLPSSISFATGPSRTADIEKTLVVGVHGPKEVYCLLCDELLA